MLEFIVATADDSKIRGWADGQLTRAREKVAILDDRKRLYLETIGVVSKLVDKETNEAEWQTQRTRFWHLYKTDLWAAVAKLIRRHLPNLLTSLRHRLTNAGLEGANAVIQWVKKTARGFRNPEHFKTAIYQPR